jgi:putative selenate reductase molybdopterin-binding subunit
MDIQFKLNGTDTTLNCAPSESLLAVLRRNRLWSVKHGCESGECGACSVLIDGKLSPTCILLSGQIEGKIVETLEGITHRHKLNPIQEAFVDTGAIQCGYCTPAMILATKELLEKNNDPTEHQARDALSGVLCRCTGYIKPVQAILRAAKLMRGEKPPPINGGGISVPDTYLTDKPKVPDFPDTLQPSGNVLTQPRVDISTITTTETTDVVGHPEPKVDAVKLAKGRPVFTDDIELPNMLHAALLTSPHAHARIKNIDTDRALSIPGVHAVLTYADIPRVIYASGGQSHPNPPPWDQVSLDSKVRYVGDRVAIVAAESPDIALQALECIEVDYEILPAVFDAHEALKPGAPQIHDEPDAVSIASAERNLAAEIRANIGDLEQGLTDSDHVFERTYKVHQVQQGHIEPHVVVTYWDEEDRLVIRSSTQVPFHVRRMIAPLLNLPVKRIRVIKPRLGGGFGGKQEMLIEDLCAHLTLATGRPVRFEYSRELEFTSSRSRHPQTLTYRAGVMNDGTLNALDLHIVENTGAFGTHGLTVCSVSGMRGLATYRCPNMQFLGEVVYTNIPIPGAYRGYGAPQAEFALECLMDEIALDMGIDSVDFRMHNAVREGDPIPITGAIGEGETIEDSAIEPQIVTSCALTDCINKGAQEIQWSRKKDVTWKINKDRPYLRRGLGIAVCMHGTAIPGLDMGAASIKINDDGSFNILVGATDLGTGSDTVLAQIAAETLGVPLEDILVYSSDTDFTPFDTGAYASSTTFISGGAVHKAAIDVRDQIFNRASLMLNTTTINGMKIHDRHVYATNGSSVSLSEIALHSLHTENQQQIMATASHMSLYSPPPFAVQYAEVEVDTETGQVTVIKLVMAVDCGTAINPITAEGQIDGGMVQALGYAICEEMPYDENGNSLVTRFGDYRIYQADEMPELVSILVPSYEPNGPYGAKAVAEIPMNGVAPAVANAIHDAVGVRVRELPLTPERIWSALRNKS